MTIAEIASRAGVSKAAVSRYLNNGYVSSEKREAIRRVIEETGYVPSQQAQTLRTGKSRMIGVIVPRIDSESISRVVAGISQVLESRGYRLLLATTANRIEKELEYLEVFRSGNVDGVILLATMLSAAHRKALAALGVPDIEGIFCATDSIAIGVKKRLEAQGKRIPEEVALVGIGHSRLSELVQPKLATAHYYYQTSGEEAARDLLEIIEQGIDRKKQLMLGFEVFAGGSV